MSENSALKASKNIKFHTQQSDDPRIEVLCYSNTSGKNHIRSFRASRIDYLENRDAGKSAIVLISGATILLSLPYAQLVEKIDEGVSPVDLKEYCEAKPLEIGDKAEDGTVYAGISPDTQRRMYAAPNDAPYGMDFNAAAEYARTLSIGGQGGFHVPTKNELSVLFNNRVKIGGFNLSGEQYLGIYRSCESQDESIAWTQNFKTGQQEDGWYKYRPMSVRCVRS